MLKKTQPALIAQPTSGEVTAARFAAKHSQTEAAAICGCDHYTTWQRYELGTRAMPRTTWAWYLLATGQHPELRIAAR